MSAGELARWAQFEREHGFPAFQAEAMTALVCATIANANRGRNARPFMLEEFMLFAPGARERAEAEAARERAGMPDPEDEADAALQVAVAMLGGHVRG